MLCQLSIIIKFPSYTFTRWLAILLGFWNDYIIWDKESQTVWMKTSCLTKEKYMCVFDQYSYILYTFLIAIRTNAMYVTLWVNEWMRYYPVLGCLRHRGPTNIGELEPPCLFSDVVSMEGGQTLDTSSVSTCLGLWIYQHIHHSKCISRLIFHPNP